MTVAATVPAQHAAVDRAAAFRGLGTWIDIYDSALLADPARTVARAASSGVRTIYVETANYHTAQGIVNRPALLELIRAAHARGIRVVGWYLPGLADVEKDARRLLAAVRIGARRDRFDAIAFDIEASIVRNPVLRTRRLLWLVDRVKRGVPRGYPLGAIVPSPPAMKLLVKSYWPAFPYRSLARRFDAFLPMCYYTYHSNERSYVRWYTRDCVSIIRRESGSNKPIHLIGGIAGRTAPVAFRTFVNAAATVAPAGVSFYGMNETTSDEFAQLRALAEHRR